MLVPVEIPAKVDYAVRALAELAAAGETVTIRSEDLAAAQEIPEHFLKSILRELRLAGLVATRRGTEGGYRLARPADEISIADVVRAVHGRLATVRGMRPEELHYQGAAEHLADVWAALRVGMRNVLERISIAELVGGTLPADLRSLIEQPDAWVPR